jgi:hypothetical protein
LEHSDAIKASQDAIRIESSGKDAGPTESSGTEAAPKQPIRQRRKKPVAKTSSHGKPASGNGRPAGQTPAATGQTAPASAIDQAAELQAALRDAVAKTTALIRTLKREKKQAKLVRSTLASLKQIQTIDG